MATATATVTVAASAILLSAAGAGNISSQTLYITNGSGAVVYLGGFNVTTVNGIPLDVSTAFPWPVKLGSGESLYAISATTSDVRVLRTGV